MKLVRIYCNCMPSKVRYIPAGRSSSQLKSWKAQALANYWYLMVRSSPVRWMNLSIMSYWYIHRCSLTQILKRCLLPAAVKVLPCAKFCAIPRWKKQLWSISTPMWLKFVKSICRNIMPVLLMINEPKYTIPMPVNGWRKPKRNSMLSLLIWPNLLKQGLLIFSIPRSFTGLCRANWLKTA